MTKSFAKTYVVVLALLLSSCWRSTTNPINGDPDSTNKKYSGLFGKLVDSKGVPVGRALIKAISTKSAPLKKSALQTETDSVTTDSNGIYSFETLTAGTYNLVGDYNKSSLVVLIADVQYDSTGAVLEVPTDTLRAPGQIAGHVATNTDDNGGVLCYIPGTSYLAVTDDSGGFTIPNLPKGAFTLAYRKEGLKASNDINIEVRSGQKTKLALKSMEADPAFPPPTPGGLTVSYDTLNGRAFLKWMPVKVSDLAGYLVYRNDTSSADPLRVSTTLAKDTTYIDTLFKNLMDAKDLNVAYRLKSQDKDANLSTIYSKAVALRAPSPTNVRTKFTLSLANTIGDSASIKDTVSIIARYSNETRQNVKISWHMSKKDSTEVFSDSSVNGSDTLKWSWPNPGRQLIYVNAKDDAGSIWWDSIAVWVVRDLPKVNAGKDTTVSINDSIFVKGSARDGFGKIVLLEWSVGGHPFFKSSTADTTIIASSSENSNYIVILKATDDDGNAVTDTAIFKVEQDPAIAKLSVPDSVRSDSLYDLRFSSSSAGKFGSIAKYECGFGSPAVFSIISGKDTVLKAPFEDQDSLPVILRVTDDDGNVGTDTHFVRIYKRWEFVGSRGFASSSVAPSLAFNNSDPYVAYTNELNGGTEIRLFDGNAWVRIGQDLPQASSGPTLAIQNGTPYLAYKDDSSGRPFVMHYGNGQWIPIGSVASGKPEAISLGFKNELPYLAFRDVSKSDSAVVLRYDGNAWVTLGSLSKQVESLPLVIDGSTPYVAFTEIGISGKTSVMRFDGNSWVPVGSPGLSQGDAGSLSLGINSGMPYLAYMDGPNSSKATLMKFDGNSWNPIGNPGFSQGRVSSVSLAFENSNPYVAYVDHANGYKITVMRYRGNAWQAVGSVGFSPDEIGYLSIVVSNGTPFIVYGSTRYTQNQDINLSHKISVMRFH